MKNRLENFAGYLVSGVFVVGAYAIARFILKIGDDAIAMFLVWLIWSDLAKHINKPDAKAS